MGTQVPATAPSAETVTVADDFFDDFSVDVPQGAPVTAAAVPAESQVMTSAPVSAATSLEVSTANEVLGRDVFDDFSLESPQAAASAVAAASELTAPAPAPAPSAAAVDLGDDFF